MTQSHIGCSYLIVIKAYTHTIALVNCMAKLASLEGRHM